jgi:hypothetical protein
MNSALALVLSAREADATTEAVRLAAGDALDLLQAATASTSAGRAFFSLT